MKDTDIERTMFSGLEESLKRSNEAQKSLHSWTSKKKQEIKEGKKFNPQIEKEIKRLGLYEDEFFNNFSPLKSVKRQIKDINYCLNYEVKYKLLTPEEADTIKVGMALSSIL